MVSYQADKAIEQQASNPDPSISAKFDQLDFTVTACLEAAATELHSAIRVEDQSGQYANHSGFIIRKLVTLPLLQPLVISIELLYREQTYGRLTLRLLTQEGQTITLRVADTTTLSAAFCDLVRFGQDLL